MNKAVVLFSGGQDSTTALMYALKKYDGVYTIGFSYGQRHSVELQCRNKILTLLRAANYEAKLLADTVVDISDLAKLTSSALTSTAPIKSGENLLPTSFVPARNIIFLGLAAAYGYDVEALNLVVGVSEVDFSGYPDCRAETILSMATTLTLGLARRVNIDAPLLHLSKAQTWDLAYKLGGEWFIDMILEETMSCYEGVRSTRHAWGYGCGSCPACVLRARGFKEYQIMKGKRLEA